MGNPHILVIPFPAQGHVIPLMELSQCLVHQGCKITFLNTECNHQKVTMMDNKENKIKLLLVDDGLSLEERMRPGKLSEAVLRVLPGKVEELIEEINGEITCVLADQSLGWALEIAERKGINRAAFCPAAAAMLVQAFSIPQLMDEGIIDNDGTPINLQTIKSSPDIPLMDTSNLVWNCLGNKTMQKNVFELMVRNTKSVKLTDWLLCNSTYDLEPEAFSMAPKVLPIGPLLATNRLHYPTGSLTDEDSSVLSWLDKQAPKSVIYVAFGSFTIFNPTQFQELALGLELSNKPFLWVVRSDLTDITKDHYPNGFYERIATRGKIVNLAPQQKVLFHPSIACFLSHCGWNSTMEGVANGVPFLCWPYFADQFLNQSYLCDVWKIGLRFNRNESGIIIRDEIRTKLEQLLGDEKINGRALDLKEMVISSISEGGTSNKNFRDFVEWLKS